MPNFNLRSNGPNDAPSGGVWVPPEWLSHSANFLQRLGWRQPDLNLRQAGFSGQIQPESDAFTPEGLFFGAAESFDEGVSFAPPRQTFGGMFRSQLADQGVTDLASILFHSLISAMGQWSGGPVAHPTRTQDFTNPLLGLYDDFDDQAIPADLDFSLTPELLPADDLVNPIPVSETADITPGSLTIDPLPTKDGFDLSSDPARRLTVSEGPPVDGSVRTLRLNTSFGSGNGVEVPIEVLMQPDVAIFIPEERLWVLPTVREVDGQRELILRYDTQLADGNDTQQGPATTPDGQAVTKRNFTVEDVQDNPDGNFAMAFDNHDGQTATVISHGGINSAENGIIIGKATVVPKNETETEHSGGGLIGIGNIPLPPAPEPEPYPEPGPYPYPEPEPCPLPPACDMPIGNPCSPCYGPGDIALAGEPWLPPLYQEPGWPGEEPLLSPWDAFEDPFIEETNWRL